MPGLILPQRLAQQPQQAAPLDTSHPRAGGLALYLPLAALGVDAVDNRAWTAVVGTTPLAFDSAARGRALSVKGASAAYLSRLLPAAISASASQPLTLRFRLYLRSVASTHAIMSWGSVAQDGAPRFYVKLNAGGTLSFYVGAAYRAYVPTVAAGTEYVITHTFDGLTHGTYINGVLIGSAVVTLAGNAASLYLGTGFDGLTASADFLLSDFAMWNRALSAQEAANDAQNPRDMLKAPPRRLWLATVGGVSPITGSFAATEASETLAAAGALGLVPISGAFSATESPDTLAASGSAAFSAISGSFASTEAPDTASGAGTVTWNPITGLFATTESADSLSASGSVSLPAITGTFAATEGADTLTGGNAAPMVGGGGGGSGGSVRDVRAFADQLERVSKQTKSHKKQVRRALETEALALLPDEPAAKEIAPLLAALVAREQAPLLAAWQPVRALMPVALPYGAEAQLMALVQQWQAEREAAEWAANDEYETELLLLGAA